VTNHRVFALLLVVTLGVSIALCQTTTAQPPAKAEPNNPFLRLLGNGVWWLNLSDDRKDTFLDGYVSGMNDANHLMMGMCDQKRNTLQPNNNNEKFMAEMYAALDLCMLGGEFDFNVDIQKLRGGVDEFYADSHNKLIPIRLAMAYVRDKLKGKKTAQELNDELQSWRRAMSQ
jgi:hypothetical protein